MRFVRRVMNSALSLAACASLLLPGCQQADAGSPDPGAGDGGLNPDTNGDAAPPDSEPTPRDLSFQPSGTLSLTAKSTRTLTVQATPAGSFLVRFALLDSDSNSPPTDAALDASDVQTDSSGVAQVTLTAASMASTFNVRASVTDKVQTRLAVVVSAPKSATLRVFPSYSGKRVVTAWTATAQKGNCEMLVGNPPPDGKLTASAPTGQPLEIANVPFGVGLAVTLRAGHYIGGCTDQAALSGGNPPAVLVYGSDRPLNLDATRLDLLFGPTDPKPALTKVMANAVSEAESALTGGAESDLTVLLDAMRDSALTTNPALFEAARAANAWAQALATALGSDAADRLRDPTGRWLESGLSRFYAANTFSATVSAATQGPRLSLLSVAGMEAPMLGFDTTFPATWSADPNDTLLLGTELRFSASKLLTGLALAPALLEFPQASTVEEALARSVDCALVAETLVAQGTTASGQAYDGCDQNCVADSCTDAVANLWRNAGDASGSTLSTLSVTGTGSAVLGDDASVTSMDGNWVGQLNTGLSSAPAAGPLSGSATPAN